MVLDNNDYNTKYYWRVIAKNSCSSSKTSTARSFRTTCENPDNFAASAINLESIDLTWTSETTTEFELEFGLKDFVRGEGTKKITTEKNFTIANLVADTEYDIYLSSLCSIGEFSDEIRKLTIKTAIDFCISGRFYDSGGVGGNYSDNENNTTIIYPSGLNERVRVSFQLFDLERDYDFLTIYDGPNQTAPELFRGSGLVSPGTLVSSHETGALTFVFTSDTGITAPGWDATVICESRPNCLPVQKITYDFKNENTISLSWLDDRSSSWEITYGLSANFEESKATVSATSNSAFEISDLESNTTYEIFVKAVCDDGGYSDPLGPISVITPCAALEAPFYENFALRETPECWLQGKLQSWRFNDFIQSGSVFVQDRTPENNTNFAYLNNSFVTAEKEVHSIQTPLISTSGLTTPSIQFSIYRTTSSTDLNHPLEVSFFDGANWNSIVVLNDSTHGWYDYVIDISPYTISGPIQVRWQISNDVPFENNDSLFLDEIKVEEMPVCPAPYGLTSSNISSDSTILTWTSQGSETNWEILYGTEGFDPINGSNTLASSNPYILENLLPQTRYDIYVKAACGIGISSKLIGPLKVTTECATFTAPYEQNFSNFGTADCWREEGVKNWRYASSYLNGEENVQDHTIGEYTNFVFIDSNNTTNKEQITTLYSNKVMLDHLQTPSVQFALYNITSQNGMYNPLTVAIFDGAIWNELLTVSSATNGWRDFYFDLSGYTLSEAVQLRFSYSEAANTYSRNTVLIDDVKFAELAICQNPYQLKASEITGAEAIMEWQTNSTETSWELNYGNQGFTVGSGTTILADSNPFQLTNLNELTTYEVYVRAVCGADERSEYVGPIQFTTTCGIKTAPYEQDFSGLRVPECWEESNTVWRYHLFEDSNNPLLNTLRIPDRTSKYFNEYAWLNPYHGEITASLTSQPIAVDGLLIPTIQFALYSNEVEENDYSTMVVEFFDGARWNQLLELQQGTKGWRDYYYDISDYTITGPVQVRFTVTNKQASGLLQNVILIDEFKVLERPSCFNPYEVTISNTTPTVATLTWQSNGSEDQWEVAIGPPSFDPNFSQVAVANTNQYEALGLMIDTDYEVYLRAKCGVETSDFIGPFYFKTICAPVEAPYTEKFAFSEMPDCWNQNVHRDWNFLNTIYDSHLESDVEDYTSEGNTNYAAIFTDSYGRGTEKILTSRSVDMSMLQVPSVSFAMYSMHNEAGLYNTLIVQVHDGTAWNTVLDLENETNGWQEYYYDISNYVTTTNIKIRFVVKDNFTNTSQYILIDDVSFGELIKCFEPRKLSVTNRTTRSAQISWSTKGPETAWDVVYVREGASFNTGSIQTVTSTNIFINNLLDATSYDVYVRANCGNDEVSEWVSFRFQTLTDFCGSGRFLDSGGLLGDYGESENITTVIAPGIEGYHVEVSFNSFELESCCDRLTVYDGPDTSAPLIGIFNSIAPETLVSSHPSGALTFVFLSDSSITASGWDASVSCEPNFSCAIFEAPFEESFEETFIPGCWTDYNSPWRVGIFDGIGVMDHTQGGNTSIAFIAGFEVNNPEQPAILESPVIDVSEMNTVLVEFALYSGYEDKNIADSATIFEAEYYDGTTWNLIYSKDTLSENGWETLRIPIEINSLDTIKLRFVIKADGIGTPSNNYYTIDDIKVYEDTALSILGLAHGKLSFTMFPNPTKDQLSIQSNEDLEKITLVNMFGQKVLVQKVIKDKNTTINVSALQAGAYFVYIETQNGTEVKRLLKE